MAQTRHFESWQMITPSFWADRQVFVTGHTGFKGSWLSLWLQMLGARVTGFALPPVSEPCLFELADVENTCVSLIGDIRDRAKINDAVMRSQPSVVLHLAAQALVRESYSDPHTTFETNVMGTLNVLQAASTCQSVKAIVIVTSDKCYHNMEWAWPYRESDHLGGHDPYSASKACAELLTQSFRASFLSQRTTADRCSVATARAGNVIGGGDWSADRLIPDILTAIDNDSTLVLRNPQATRPWQHVLEPLCGYLMVAERLLIEGQPWDTAWNFGPDESDVCAVSDIVERLGQHMGKRCQWRLAEGAEPYEAQSLRLDSSQARQQLNWQPLWTIEQCLAEIASWQSHYSSGQSVRQACMNTIQRYSQQQAKS